MAQLAKRLSQNVAGEFYVDSTCIDCDACRQIASTTFHDHGGQSSVFHQPEDSRELERALMALVACPTASIGSSLRRSARPGIAAFPAPVVDNIYFCGFTSESSFGAWSYLIVRAPELGGNVLVDSPRYASVLVEKIEKMGGVQTMFLSHRDDIADHAKYAAHFGCERIMHEGDHASRLGIERVLHGEEEVRLDDELLVIPTPGHTRGHQVLLYRNQALFTRGPPSLVASTTDADGISRCVLVFLERADPFDGETSGPPVCVGIARTRRIHGASPEDMHQQLESCVEWMKTV